MARMNAKAAKTAKTTHEGAPAANINSEQQLRRLVMAHLLWEDTFYLDGQSSADLVASAVANVKAEKVRDIAIEARTKMKLRHVPLLLARTMAALPTHRHVVADTLAQVIQRPDELAEYVSIYWKDKRQTLSSQSKRGLALAFRKFNEYSLQKYNNMERAVKLRDVLFLCHAKPVDEAQDALWKRLKDNQLATPDTWETMLSANKGENKRAVWEMLLREKKLGALALLRNLRNFRDALVDESLVTSALKEIDVARVLPFRFIAAARHNPQWEPQIEQAMFRATATLQKLPGKTAIVVDHSGSMYGTKVSAKSELERIDAACALAILAREVCEEVVVIGFATRPSIVPARRGFALRDAIAKLEKGSTNTQLALDLAAKEKYDRIIVITDEQSHQQISGPRAGTKAYFINVANYKNGIGYGQWVNITGWSEAVLQYVAAEEGLGLEPVEEIAA